MVKMTFTFDIPTAEVLRRTASRLKKPKSVVVREAIQHYASRTDRQIEDERRPMLRVLDRVMSRPQERTQSEVDSEIRNLRASRKSGGRRTPLE
jgi:hypothetical protein